MRLEKRKLNGMALKKGGTVGWEACNAKEEYAEDDQVVSKHTEGSGPWVSWRPAALAAVATFVNTWLTYQRVVIHLADCAKLRQVQAQLSSGLGFGEIRNNRNVLKKKK